VTPITLGSLSSSSGSAVVSVTSAEFQRYASDTAPSSRACVRACVYVSRGGRNNRAKFCIKWTSVTRRTPPAACLPTALGLSLLSNKSIVTEIRFITDFLRASDVQCIQGRAATARRICHIYQAVSTIYYN